MNRFYQVTAALIFLILVTGCGDTVPKEKSQAVPKLPGVEEVELKDYELFLGEKISDALENEIDEAKESIRLGMYRFCTTNCRILKPILDSLIEAKQRGVDVRVYLELIDESNNSPSNYLAGKGVKVYNYQRPDYQYHRFMVIDGKTVFFGSQKFTCIELSGRGYGLGMIANNKKLAGKIEQFLNHQTVNAKLIGPERDNWPLSIRPQLLVERQRKMTASIRETLGGLTKSPELETCWKYLTPELKNSVLNILITELDRGDTEAQSTADLIRELKNQPESEDKIKIRQVHKLLKSFHPDILEQLQNIISNLQHKIQRNLDDIILHDIDKAGVIEPMWFLGPQFTFRRYKKNWLLADIRWPSLDSKTGIKPNKPTGVLSLYYQTDKNKILTELKTKETPRIYQSDRINTKIVPTRLTLSRWDDRRLMFRLTIPVLENLPLPPGRGIEENIKLTVDGWKNNKRKKLEQKIFITNETLRRSSSRKYSVSLRAETINPPENLQALQGKLIIKFPLQLYKAEIDKQSFLKNTKYEWGEIINWEENAVHIMLHPNYNKELFYISAKNKTGEYISVHTRSTGNVIKIRSYRDKIDHIELFFSKEYFEWKKDFELPFSVHEGTYTIEELKEGITLGKTDIKLNNISTDDKDRLKLEFKLSDGIQRILQWQPYSITKEKIRPRSTRRDYSNNLITHHVEELPRSYKIRLGSTD